MFKKESSKIFLITLYVLIFFPFLGFAADLVTPPGQKNISISGIMSQVFTPLWQLFAGLAVIMFVIAGVLFLTSAGDPGKIATAKQAVIWGIVGIVVATLAFSIVQIVSGWI